MVKSQKNSLLGAHAMTSVLLAFNLSALYSLPLSEKYQAQLLVSLAAITIIRVALPLSEAFSLVTLDIMHCYHAQDPTGAAHKQISFALRFGLLDDIYRKSCRSPRPVLLYSSCVLWSTVAVQLLQTLQYDVTPVLTSFGVGSIIVGLSVQATIKDLIAFVIIVFEAPFKVNTNAFPV